MGSTRPAALGQQRGITSPLRLPFVPGNELAGTVSALGAGATGFHVGDRVFARTDKGRLGALAERVAIRAELVAQLGLVPGADLRSLVERVEPGGRLVSVAATPTPGSIRHDYEMPAWRGLALDTALSLLTARTRRHSRRHAVTYQRLSIRPDAADLRTLAALVDDDALRQTRGQEVLSRPELYR